MIYSRQMQGVCDTLLSPEMLSVINELFGHQVQRSRRVSGSGAGLHYMQSSQRGSARLPGAMGNIYRTDTLTTINDNWLSVSNGWSEKSTRGKGLPHGRFDLGLEDEVKARHLCPVMWFYMQAHLCGWFMHCRSQTRSSVCPETGRFDPCLHHTKDC